MYAVPTCGKPVGEGAMRVRTVMAAAQNQKMGKHSKKLPIDRSIPHDDGLKQQMTKHSISSSLGLRC